MHENRTLSVCFTDNASAAEYGVLWHSVALAVYDSEGWITALDWVEVVIADFDFISDILFCLEVYRVYSACTPQCPHEQSGSTALHLSKSCPLSWSTCPRTRLIVPLMIPPAATVDRPATAIIALALGLPSTKTSCIQSGALPSPSMFGNLFMMLIMFFETVADSVTINSLDLV